MSKYIVCVFDDEKTTYEAAKALRALDNEGSIAVYEGAIVAKNEKGTVRILDEASDAPFGTMSGMLLGSLIGVIGGPAGMAVGAAVGSLGGLLVDAHDAGVGADFLDDVGAALTPGKFAVVAEADEAWTVPLDTRMEKLGGTVHRAWRIDVEDEQIERDAQAAKRERQELKEEWRAASEDAKAKIKAKMDAVDAKLKTLDDKAKAKMESMKKATSAKLEKLEAQIAKSSDEMKQKYEAKRQEVKADDERRMTKLREAGKLAAAAFA